MHIPFNIPLDPAVHALSCTFTDTTITKINNDHRNDGAQQQQQFKSTATTPTYRLITRKIPGWVNVEDILGQLKDNNPTVSWLDSSRVSK